MTALDGSTLEDRLKQLEAEVLLLRDSLQAPVPEPPHNSNGDQLELFQTKAGATAYPAPGSDTFPAVRIAARFPKTQGTQTIESVEIDDKDERFILKSPDNLFIDEGKKVVAVFKPPNWWVVSLGGSGSSMIFGQVVNAANYEDTDIEMTREDGGANITDIRWDRFGCDGDHLEIDDWIGIVEATDGIETWWRIVRHHNFSVLEIRADATVGDENIFLDRDDNACYTVESGDCS